MQTVSLTWEHSFELGAVLGVQKLSADQAAVVAGVLGSGRTVDVLVGPAGTGKSHTVGALSAVWAGEHGGRVLGLATAEMAARNLAEKVTKLRHG